MRWRAAPRTSSAEDTTPSQPASSARRARDSTSCSTSHWKPRSVKIAAVQTGQHSDGQYLDVALGRSGRLHHRLIAVHRREGDAAVVQLAHRRRDRGRDIEELQVDEDSFAARRQPIEQLEIATGHEQLEPELVELHRIAEPLDQRARRCGIGHVEREDQALIRGYRGRHGKGAVSQSAPRSRCARPDRTAADARGSHSGRSCRRCNRIRCAPARAVPSRCLGAQRGVAILVRHAA